MGYTHTYTHAWHLAWVARWRHRLSLMGKPLVALLSTEVQAPCVPSRWASKPSWWLRCSICRWRLKMLLVTGSVGGGGRVSVLWRTLNAGSVVTSSLLHLVGSGAEWGRACTHGCSSQAMSRFLSRALVAISSSKTAADGYVHVGCSEFVPGSGAGELQRYRSPLCVDSGVVPVGLRDLPNSSASDPRCALYLRSSLLSSSIPIRRAPAPLHG